MVCSGSFDTNSSVTFLDILSTRLFILIDNYRLFYDKKSLILNNDSTEALRLSEYNFSDREVEVVRLVLKGKNNKDIAKKLFISESTVKKHLNSIFKKSGSNSRWNLIQLFK